MSEGWGEVNGAIAWKKWLIGLSVNVLWSGILWRVGGAGLMAGVHVKIEFHVTGSVRVCGSHDGAA